MAQYYDRYEKFRANGEVKPIPGIKIPVDPNDKQAKYKSGQTRFDKLSQEYYGNPYHGWLILLGNPIYGGVEENIPDKEIIRIPFPLTDSIQQYIKAVEKYRILNGID